MRMFVLCFVLMLTSSLMAETTPDEPQERTDANSRLAHQQLVEKAGQGTIDVYFVGDSITRRSAHGLPATAGQLAGESLRLECGQFRLGGDGTEQHLWRLKHGLNSRACGPRCSSCWRNE